MKDDVGVEIEVACHRSGAAADVNTTGNHDVTYPVLCLFLFLFPCHDPVLVRVRVRGPYTAVTSCQTAESNASVKAVTCAKNDQKHVKNENENENEGANLSPSLAPVLCLCLYLPESDLHHYQRLSLRHQVH